MPERDKNLVQLIRDNPGATFLIDIDWWAMHGVPPKPLDEMTDEELDDWYDSPLCDSDNVIKDLDGYGNIIAGDDVIRALAMLAKVNLEYI